MGWEGCKNGMKFQMGPWEMFCFFFKVKKWPYSCCILNFPGPNGAVVRRRYSCEGNRRAKKRLRTFDGKNCCGILYLLICMKYHYYIYSNIFAYNPANHEIFAISTGANGFFHQQHTCLSVDTSWSNQHQIALTVVVVWAVFWVGGFTCWRSEASVKMFAICCPRSFSQWCDCKDCFNPLMLWSTPSRKARGCTDNWHPLIPTLMSLQLRVLVFGIVGPMSFGGVIWVAVVLRWFTVDLQVWFSGPCNSLAIAVSSGIDILIFSQTQDMQEALVLFTYWNVLGSMIHVVHLIAAWGTLFNNLYVWKESPLGVCFLYRVAMPAMPRNIMDIGEGEPLFGNFEYEDLPCGPPHNNHMDQWESLRILKYEFNLHNCHFSIFFLLSCFAGRGVWAWVNCDG